MSYELHFKERHFYYVVKYSLQVCKKEISFYIRKVGAEAWEDILLMDASPAATLYYVY